MGVSYGSAVAEPGPHVAIRSAARPEASGPAEPAGFQVKLANFTGPFDLLLQLIGKHKLDVTEVALHRVTDDFIAYIRAMGDDWDLDEASEFLVIAATLLDLKAARLLPAASVEDEEDLALLEARDLLFARLLQYRAFKEAAAHIAGLEAAGVPPLPARRCRWSRGTPRRCPNWCSASARDRLAALAVKALTPKPVPSGVDRPRAPGAGQRPRARRHPAGQAAAGAGWPPSARCAPTARTPWRWWRGSWRCWSCTARAWSASTRCRRWVS